jgi:hypothetical protein
LWWWMRRARDFLMSPRRAGPWTYIINVWMGLWVGGWVDGWVGCGWVVDG